MKKRAIRKYAIEAFLIVFSVLLALFLNKVFENQKINEQERVAKESLVRELTHNLRVTKDILRLHKNILTRLDSAKDLPDSGLEHLFPNQRLDLARLIGGESLMKELLTSTGWETARSTGIIAEFDYSEVENLTKVYTLQDVVLNKTLAGIVEVLFRTETHDPANIEATLLQLRLRFNELVGQENILVSIYEEAVKDLRKQP